MRVGRHILSIFKTLSIQKPNSTTHLLTAKQSEDWLHCRGTRLVEHTSRDRGKVSFNMKAKKRLTAINWAGSSGGIYSSNNDLLSFGTSILSSRLLGPEKTRAWLKPRTFTSASSLSVRFAWEITHTANLTSDRRDIQPYTKTGNQGEYSNVLARSRTMVWSLR